MVVSWTLFGQPQSGRHDIGLGRRWEAILFNQEMGGYFILSGDGGLVCDCYLSLL